HAGARGDQMLALNLWHQALQGADESGLAERAVQLAQADTPILPSQPLKATIGQRFGQIKEIDVPLTIAFARKGEHRIRTAFDTAIDHAGEVDAEERKVRIRHWVNQVPAKVLGLGL